MSPSKFLGIPENFSAHGGQVDHMIDVVHWFMIALFVGWTLFFFYCIFRFWHKNNPKASYEGVKKPSLQPFGNRRDHRRGRFAFGFRIPSLGRAG